MLVGRFMLMIPVLAIAGSLGRKQKVPVSAGTFPTNTGLFSALLTGVVVIVVGLTYFPVVSLGPIVEHLQGKLCHPGARRAPPTPAPAPSRPPAPAPPPPHP